MKNVSGKGGKVMRQSFGSCQGVLYLNALLRGCYGVFGLENSKHLIWLDSHFLFLCLLEGLRFEVSEVSYILYT